MDGNYERPRTASARVQRALELNRNVLTPEHRAIERIKRKATGMALAGSSRISVDGVVTAQQRLAPELFQLQLARKCASRRRMR